MNKFSYICLRAQSETISYQTNCTSNEKSNKSTPDAWRRALITFESNGEAAIIDPLRETGPYLTKAEQNGVRIKYIFETHFHADFGFRPSRPRPKKQVRKSSTAPMPILLTKNTLRRTVRNSSWVM